ncbi:hypothetical protein GQ457_05G018210 [Hibiscus cannabinus]
MTGPWWLCWKRELTIIKQIVWYGSWGFPTHSESKLEDLVGIFSSFIFMPIFVTIINPKRLTQGKRSMDP